jgi:16S rRNA (guanine1207-N2)-methyltransferase
MSRWAEDPDHAADALIERCLDELAFSGRILLVNQRATLPRLLEARGLACAVWNRRLTGAHGAAPWPPPGPFDVGLVRLPKARDELRMTTHAVLSVLAAGGRLILYGGNEEGIRSAAGLLQEAAGSVEVVAARGHGRVLTAKRPEMFAGLQVRLQDWRMVTRIGVAGAARDWISYPGIFAAGRLDEGTALLIGVLPALASGARVLDYGCGSGVIGAAALMLQPGIALDMLDSDAVALEAVRENVPAGRRILGRRVADAGTTRYQAILSNPPLHEGVAEDHGLLERLIADAPAALAPGGALQIVVQRRVPLERLLAAHFPVIDIVAETGRYRVWRAVTS